MTHPDATELTPRERAYLYMALALYQGVGAVAYSEEHLRFAPFARWRHPTRAPYREISRRWCIDRLEIYDERVESARRSAHTDHCVSVMNLCTPAIAMEDAGPSSLEKALRVLGAEDSLARRAFSLSWSNRFPDVIVPGLPSQLEHLWPAVAASIERTHHLATAV